MKIKLFVLSFLLCSLSVHAQRKIEHASVDDVLEQTGIKKQSKFHFDLDYRYLFIVSHRAVGQTFTRKTEDKMKGNQYRLSFRYDVHPRFSLGVGTGLDLDDDIHTLALFGTLRYNIQRVKNLYAFTNIGFSPRMEMVKPHGAFFDIGIGYNKMFAKHFGINFQLGYNFHAFRKMTLGYFYNRIDDESKLPKDYYYDDEGTIKRNAFFATVGLTF